MTIPGDPARNLDTIVEASQTAIATHDLSGVVHTWNQAAERLYGYTAGEMVGRSVTMLVPPDRAKEVSWITDQIRSGQKVADMETVRIVKGGRPVDVSLSIIPLENGSGDVIGMVLMSRKTDAREQADLALQLKEARWRAIIDSAVDGIVVIDAHGHIEAFNAGAERMFGYTQDEVLGKNVNSLMPSPYREDHDGYIERYLRTGDRKIIGIGRDVAARRRDGSVFPIHLSVGEARVGNEPRFTGILHDLSARVALEERLREQSALARVGEMSAVIAHEVKNPLAAVRGAIQVIGGRLPADSRETPVVQEVLARLDGLNRLIDDLLLFARPPQLRLCTIDLVPLLQRTSDLLARDPAFGGVHVDISGTAPPIEGDPDLLKIVFQNLLINAAQAMSGHGMVRVSVVSENGRHRLTVSDEGPGIPPDVRAQLFRPFFTTKARGTGLGLSIAKRVVDAHDGTMTVTCPSKGGTQVTIELPTNAQSGVLA